MAMKGLFGERPNREGCPRPPTPWNPFRRSFSTQPRLRLLSWAGDHSETATHDRQGREKHTGCRHHRIQWSDWLRPRNLSADRMANSPAWLIFNFGLSFEQLIPGLCRFARHRFNRRYMQQRENFEFRGNAILGKIDSYQQTGPCQHRHLRMTNLESLTTGQCDPDRLKRASRKHFTEGLDRHTCNYSRQTPASKQIYCIGPLHMLSILCA